jgi:tetratricopeptide (TPR) repeat protein
MISIPALQAQAPGSIAPAGGGGAATPPPASSPGGGSSAAASGSKDGGFLGKDLPVFDPATDIASWDGKAWNVNNNRLFRARFEKYLNAPEEVTESDQAYQKIIREIDDKLAPQNVRKPGAMDDAWALLTHASDYEIDAGLCDRIADAVFAVWMAKGEQKRLQQANESLRRLIETQQNNAEANYEMGIIQRQPPKDKALTTAYTKEVEEKRALRLAPYLERVAEMKAEQVSNSLKKNTSELQTRLSYQALIVQLFMQRRFQHVLIATRFYRALYQDGDTQMQVAGNMKEEFTKGADMPFTVDMLDSLAGEALRDVKEGVSAYTFLLDKKEMTGASERLAEAFAIGEYVPEIRALPRDKKRQVLDYTQKGNQLLSAIEVKDFDTAEKLLGEIKAVASDFDPVKANVAIQTSKNGSNFYLAKAKVAATQNDQVAFEENFAKAVAAWPTNPALSQAGAKVFEQSDAQQQAINDFNRLVAQKNYRQIYDDKERFIVYTALDPAKKDELKKVLEQMQVIEGSILRANEMARLGDYTGAWETVEVAIKDHPEDNKLNQVRANYTTEAADFVRSIRTAEDLEKKNEYGSSLAWYLKAQRMYPPSEFAKDGINRMVKIILPEGDAARQN